MQVAYQIAVEGTNITALVADRLLSAEITDEAGVKSDRLTLTLDDRDQRLEFPKTGAEIEISLGYVGKALLKMGTYVVDEVEASGPGREMMIRANAANMTGGIKAPKERSFDGITLGNLVRTIAGEHGLEPAVAAELASRALGHIDQTESDMQLLQRICAEQGATCKIADNRLVVAKHAEGKTASGGELPKKTLTPGDCESWTATVAKRNDYKAVKAFFQDVKRADRIGVTAGSGTPMMSLKNTYSTQAEARQAAESKLKALQRGASKVSINGLIGDPSMSAELTVELSGFRQGVDGSDWVVNRVTHSFSGSGYTCSLELESKE
jgi:phage protein D